MDADQRRALIDRYRDGPQVVADALAGATDAELDRDPGGGEWTARQVAPHLADSEATSYIRLRRLVAEDDPVIAAYDENLFARRLHYDRPVAASLDVLRAVRAASAELLDVLTEDEWSRSGTHTDDGPYSVDIWLENYAAHAHDHADQIRRALGR
ncbi:MAG TPA: DinB family protein [Acidimicrobiales bacterium]|jgi:hypothetical protein